MRGREEEKERQRERERERERETVVETDDRVLAAPIIVHSSTRLYSFATNTKRNFRPLILSRKSIHRNSQSTE